jgi:CRISPR/Cas system CMR subunit Cmr6 (Cas7 group RAMP superfamily)
MLRILKSIQVGDIDEKTSKEAMVLIIDKLKKSKNNITSILKKKKEGFEKRLENKKKVFSRL